MLQVIQFSTRSQIRQPFPENTARQDSMPLPELVIDRDDGNININLLGGHGL